MLVCCTRFVSLGSKGKAMADKSTWCPDSPQGSVRNMQQFGNSYYSYICNRWHVKLYSISIEALLKLKYKSHPPHPGVKKESTEPFI